MQLSTNGWLHSVVQVHSSSTKIVAGKTPLKHIWGVFCVWKSFWETSSKVLTKRLFGVFWLFLTWESRASVWVCYLTMSSCCLPQSRCDVNMVTGGYNLFVQIEHNIIGWTSPLSSSLELFKALDEKETITGIFLKGTIFYAVVPFFFLPFILT